MFKIRFNRPARPGAAHRETAAVRAANQEAARRAVDYERWLAERRYRTQLPAGPA